MRLRLIEPGLALAAAAVALASLALPGCGGAPTVRPAGKPLVPALDIRPRKATIPARSTLRFTAYLVEGRTASLIDPSDVNWSVSRARGGAGTIHDGLFSAPRDFSEYPVRVRGVYEGERTAGIASDLALVTIVPSAGKEATSAYTTGDRSLIGPSVVGQRIFDNSNANAVRSGPTAPTAFSIGKWRRIVYVVTYHWNGGRGARPGSISLRGSHGRTYGPWRASGSPGKGGARDVYWVVHPNVALAPGTYAVIDSSAETWSYNEGSGGRGMCVIEAAGR